MLDHNSPSHPTLPIESLDYLRGLVPAAVVVYQHVFTPRFLGTFWVGYGTAAVGTLALPCMRYRWLELIAPRVSTKAISGPTCVRR